MDSDNITEVPDVTTHVPHNCSGADQTSLSQFREVSWWFSGVGQVKKDFCNKSYKDNTCFSRPTDFNLHCGAFGKLSINCSP